MLQQKVLDHKYQNGEDPNGNKLLHKIRCKRSNDDSDSLQIPHNNQTCTDIPKQLNIPMVSSPELRLWAPPEQVTAFNSFHCQEPLVPGRHYIYLWIIQFLHPVLIIREVLCSVTTHSYINELNCVNLAHTVCYNSVAKCVSNCKKNNPINSWIN